MTQKREIQTEIDNNRLMTRLSVGGGTAALILLVLTLVLRSFRGGDVFYLAALPYALAVLFAAAAMIYGILGTSAALEEEEKKLLAKRAESRALDVEEDVRFTAGRSFANYRRFAPYAVTVLAALLTGTMIYFYRADLAGRSVSAMNGAAIHSALIAAVMMLLSVFAGAFFVGQSRSRGFRWLRPIGAWLIAAFAVMLVATATAICFSNNLKSIDHTAAVVILWIFAVLGIEFIVNFIIEFYRPRTLQESRPIFESQLLALFTEPGGIMRNIASALDYQFGFKVSGTWIYSFLEKSFFPTILVWALLLWGFTMVHEIGPSEVGVKENLGCVVSKELPPGIYWSLPAPFGTVRHFSTTELQQLTLGETHSAQKNDAAEAPDDGHGHSKPAPANDKNKPTRVVTWTTAHGADDDNFIVAVPDEVGKTARDNEAASISFVRMSVPVQFRIKPNGVMDYAYRNVNPRKTLMLAGQQVLTEYLASCSMQEVMSTHRHSAEKEVRDRIQRVADRLHLGVEIVSVTITDAHPPVGEEGFEVAAAFQNIIGAMESRMTEILKAEAYMAQQKPESIAAASERIAAARSYSYSTRTVAAAEAERFRTQLNTYLVMPEMFKLRTYLDFLEKDCGSMRKFILSSDLGSEILQFNLEVKERLDLVDTDITKLTYN